MLERSDGVVDSWLSQTDGNEQLEDERDQGDLKEDGIPNVSFRFEAEGGDLWCRGGAVLCSDPGF